jgi:hypothetical protein
MLVQWGGPAAALAATRQVLLVAGRLAFAVRYLVAYADSNPVRVTTSKSNTQLACSRPTTAYVILYVYTFLVIFVTKMSHTCSDAALDALSLGMFDSDDGRAINNATSYPLSAVTCKDSPDDHEEVNLDSVHEMQTCLRMSLRPHQANKGSAYCVWLPPCLEKIAMIVGTARDVASLSASFP